jgi:hypothetical protein
MLALALRLFGAFTFGAGYDGPGTFKVINHDENGSCKARLGQFPYSPFIGYQTVFLAQLAGQPPPDIPKNSQLRNDTLLEPGSPEIAHIAAARKYCYSRDLIIIARLYSAVTGALTVVLLGILALLMWPQRSQIAWTACALLGLSNFHVAESHFGTVDAPLVFFIMLFTVVLYYGIVSGRKWAVAASLPLLGFVVWTKYYLFSVFSYLALSSEPHFRRRWKLYLGIATGIAVAGVFLVGWDRIAPTISRYSYLLWGEETSRFGTGYGHIGSWRRWIRNGTNLGTVHLVGLGIPAALFAVAGLKRVITSKKELRHWLIHAPAAFYALYMLLLAPVTYYRHYLPLFPTVALLSAYGLWHSRWATRKWFLLVFFVYPCLLTLDSEYQYRFDPRRACLSWYDEHQDAQVCCTYYVGAPAYHRAQGLFSMNRYVYEGERYLRQNDYLILSESWYDTAYPSELNGPIAWKPEWLIKTRPEYARAYRKILSGQDRNLQLEAEFNLRHFTPEFLLHRLLYGSFQLFVGDLKIYRVVK